MAVFIVSVIACIIIIIFTILDQIMGRIIPMFKYVKWVLIIAFYFWFLKDILNDRAETRFNEIERYVEIETIPNTDSIKLGGITYGISEKETTVYEYGGVTYNRLINNRWQPKINGKDRLQLFIYLGRDSLITKDSTKVFLEKKIKHKKILQRNIYRDFDIGLDEFVASAIIFTVFYLICIGSVLLLVSPILFGFKTLDSINEKKDKEKDCTEL